MPAPSSVPGRAPVAADLDVDVCIVGAGFHRAVDRVLPQRPAPQWSIPRARCGARRLRCERTATADGSRCSGRSARHHRCGVRCGCGSVARRGATGHGGRGRAGVRRGVADAGFVGRDRRRGAQRRSGGPELRGEVAAALQWAVGSRWLDTAAARERLVAILAVQGDLLARPGCSRPSWPSSTRRGGGATQVIIAEKSGCRMSVQGSFRLRLLATGPV